MIMNNQLRICVGASAGGHMNQLMQLLKVSGNWPKQPDFYITTMDEVAKKLEEKGPVYVVGECNRQHPLKAIAVFARCMRIIAKERPDVVITTGSLPLAFACLCARLYGAKIVWIDSIANIERFSMSGRLMRHFAHLFLTQWPDLAKKYNNVEYAGAIV